MAKRRADLQITRDNPGGGDSSSDEEEEGGGQQMQQLAAPEVLARRKIAIPHRRQGLDHQSSSSRPPFAGFAKPEPQKSTPFAFLNNNHSNSQSTSSTNQQRSTHSDAQLRLKGLNTNFADQIAKAAQVSPFEDWSEMCNKYLHYSRQINGQQAEGKTLDSVSEVSTIQENPDGESTYQENAKSISTRGFKFGSATGHSNSFQFGDKKIEIQKMPSSSSSTGFVFNPSGTGTIKFGSESKPNSASADASLMNDSVDENDSENNTKETKSTEIAVDKPKPFEASKPVFSFGKKPEDDSNLNAHKTEDTFKPTFSFGNPTTDPSKAQLESNSKPAFTFGSSSVAHDNQAKFTFSVANQSNSGLTNNASAPKFSFGKPESGSESSKSLETKPVFSFGSVGSTCGATSFNDSKPKFSFGQPSTESKPTFSFGNPGENKSGFSFGKSANPFSKSTSSESDTKTGSIWNSNATTVNSTEHNTDTGATAEGISEPSDALNDPQTDLAGPGPGEEDEDCIYEKRAKAHELVKKEENGATKADYQLLGLGMLRILKHKETGKVRALLRAEGSGRILLNIPIRKEFSYSVIGKGQVKLPDVKPGSDSPTVYLVRVKTEEDANQLKDKLEGK